MSNVTCVDADTDGLRALLSPWVSGYYPSCRIGYSKPDPRAFRTVADQHSTDPARMIHVGDDWACGIEGPLKAGALAIWVSRGRHVPDEALVVDRGVLVAHDLGSAATHIQHLARTTL